MARSDLLIALARAGSSGDQVLFRKALESIVSEERNQQHHVLADALSKYLGSLPASSNGDSHQGLLYELQPVRRLDDLILSPSVRKAVQELVEEQHRADLLRSHGLEPRHRILLLGPPGNGKTSLAEAIAEALFVPLLVVRYDAVIGSFLGETSARLRRLIDYARTRRCVLFFDEFDTLGKERGDPHDTGEVKRVVSSLLMQIDGLPSYVVVIAATNHAELLDRAVWRRFQIRLELPLPTRRQTEEWLDRMWHRLHLAPVISSRTLATHLHGHSFAELEEFTGDTMRQLLLRVPDASPSEVIRDRVRQWIARRAAVRGKLNRP